MDLDESKSDTFFDKSNVSKLSLRKSTCSIMKFTALCVFFFFFSISVFPQKLLVELSGIRNKDGCIRLAFFRNDSEFLAEQPVLERIVDKSTIRDGNLSVLLDSIPVGEYGIALLDDENKNGKLDYKLIIPKEGVGFSNYVLQGFRRPRFRDFAFLVRKNVTLRVIIRLTYY